MGRGSSVDSMPDLLESSELVGVGISRRNCGEAGRAAVSAGWVLDTGVAVGAVPDGIRDEWRGFVEAVVRNADDKPSPETELELIFKRDFGV